jgi:hypothetical protein
MFLDARAIGRGLLAAALGTLAMDLVWYARYKRGGGESGFLDWEFSVGLNDWENASAPAKVGKLLYEFVFKQELSARYAMLTNNVMHWGYGVQWGGVLGAAIGSLCAARLRQGPLLGALVWLASYVSLPIAGFYKPIWEYDLKTLWDDLSAHLVYGATVGLVMRLTRPRDCA